MYLWYLFVFLVAILMLSIVITGGDILAPLNVFIMTYIFACVFAIYVERKWDIHIELRTFLLFILGTVIFVIVSMFFLPDRRKSYPLFVRIIEISDRKIIVLCLISLWSIISTYLYIWRLSAHNIALYDFFSVFSSYRTYSVMHPESGLPAYLSYGGKIPEIASYIMMFAYINNVAIEKKFFKHIKYLVMSGLEIIHVLESGARAGILNIIVAFVSCAYIYIYRDKSIALKIRQILKYTFCAILFLLLFYNLAIRLERAGNGTMIDYIAIYTGTPLELLNVFIEGESFKRQLFGQETFYPLIRRLHLLGLITEVPTKYSVHLPFIYMHGVNFGNVYTAYRRWFNDFGLFGVILFQTAFSSFYNYLYKRIVDHPFQQEKLVVLYMYYVSPLYQHFYDDKLFRQILSSSSIINVILIYLLYQYLVNENEFDIYF